MAGWESVRSLGLLSWGEVSGVASGGQRPAEAGKVDEAELGCARLRSAWPGRGARRISTVFGAQSGSRRRGPSGFGFGGAPKTFGNPRRRKNSLRVGGGWEGTGKVTLHPPKQLATCFS